MDTVKSNGHYAAGDACFKRDEHAAAAEHFQRGCDEGDAGSQLRLGMLYYAGSGVPRDVAKAAGLWHLAADQGNAIAEYNLGAVYRTGEGVQRDFEKAEKYYKRAAEPSKRCFEAQCALGCILFESGDYAGALAVFEQAASGNQAAADVKMAANQGASAALFNMALMYLNGAGVRKDRAVAVEYFKRAADKGDAEAQWNVAMLYKHGDGVARNPAAASWYFARAAEQGITRAPDDPAEEPPKRKPRARAARA